MRLGVPWRASSDGLPLGFQFHIWSVSPPTLPGVLDPYLDPPRPPERLLVALRGNLTRLCEMDEASCYGPGGQSPRLALLFGIDPVFGDLDGGVGNSPMVGWNQVSGSVSEASFPQANTENRLLLFIVRTATKDLGL